MASIGFLREIKFEATPKCNQQCSFCFNRNSFAAGGRTSSRELSTQDALKVVDNVVESGVETIRFTGGEPLVRKDLATLCKYAKARGLNVRLNTNGSFFNQQLLHDISRVADEVFFPLHALDAAEDAGKTGLKGAFNRKLSAMKKLRSSAKVCAGTIATKDNVLRLERFAALAETCCDEWFALRPIPSVGHENPLELKDVEVLADKLVKLSETTDCKIYHAIPFCSAPGGKLSKVAVGANYCGPLYNLVLRPDGTIVPCYSIQERLGNALHDSIREVWETHPFVKKAREFGFIPKKCKKCSFKTACMGGCRFAAKLIGGSYSSKDPLMP